MNEDGRIRLASIEQWICLPREARKSPREEPKRQGLAEMHPEPEGYKNP